MAMGIEDDGDIDIDVDVDESSRIRNNNYYYRRASDIEIVKHPKSVFEESMKTKRVTGPGRTSGRMKKRGASSSSSPSTLLRPTTASTKSSSRAAANENKRKKTNQHEQATTTTKIGDKIFAFDQIWAGTVLATKKSKSKSKSSNQHQEQQQQQQQQQELEIRWDGFNPSGDEWISEHQLVVPSTASTTTTTHKSKIFLAQLATKAFAVCACTIDDVPSDDDDEPSQQEAAAAQPSPQSSTTMTKAPRDEEQASFPKESSPSLPPSQDEGASSSTTGIAKDKTDDFSCPRTTPPSSSSQGLELKEHVQMTQAQCNAVVSQAMISHNPDMIQKGVVSQRVLAVLGTLQALPTLSGLRENHQNLVLEEAGGLDKKFESFLSGEYLKRWSKAEVLFKGAVDLLTGVENDSNQPVLKGMDVNSDVMQDLMNQWKEAERHLVAAVQSLSRN